jgi:hypothetical protein
MVLQLAARIQHAEDHKTQLLRLELENGGDVRQMVDKVSQYCVRVCH